MSWLSADERQLFDGWLRVKRITPGCVACGAETWKDPKKRCLLPADQTAALSSHSVPIGSALPEIVIVQYCGNCGSARFFAASIVSPT